MRGEETGGYGMANAIDMINQSFRHQNADLFDSSKETIIPPAAGFSQTDERYEGFNLEGTLPELEMGNGQTTPGEVAYYG